MVGWSVHFFLTFQKERFRESNAVLNCTDQQKDHLCSVCTAADIPECTYVQSKSVQNKLTCIVEYVTSIDSRSNVLGCSQTVADSKQEQYVCYSAYNARFMHGHYSP